MRGVQLLVLALVSVFETWMICGRVVGAVVPQSGQRYEMIGDVMGAHTLLSSGILLVGGERGVCTSWVQLLLVRDCL